MFPSNINYKKILRKRVPIINWLPQYRFSTFFQDLVAGVTVGLAEIPQAIAHAGLAGLPLEYGFYSGLTDGFVYAIFGGCKELNVGPSAVLSIMIQPHVAKMGSDAAILMTFLSGVIIFLMSVLHLGFISQFLSYPVIAGFLCGAVFQIGSSQLINILGIPVKGQTFLECWEIIVNNTDKIQKWDVILGVISLLFLIISKEISVFGSLKTKPNWSRRRNILGKFIFILSITRNALVVIVGTLIAYCLREESPFRLTGTVSAGFPPVQPPPFTTNFNGSDYNFLEMSKSYSVSIVLFPLLIIMDAFTAVKIFSEGKSFDGSQEMLAVGFCNIVGSFVGSMPVTGSVSRSAVNNASGVRTPLAGVFTSLLLFLAIAFLTPLFYYVPKTTLAAVLLTAVLYLFQFKAFKLFWTAKKLEFIPFLTTLFCTVFVSIGEGIVIGIAVNLIFVLYASARPKFNMVRQNVANICTIIPKDTLYFPAAEHLRDMVLKCESKIVVIDGKYIHKMDTTIAKNIAVLVQELPMRKQKIVLLDFKKSVIDVCLGIDDTLKHHFFSTENFDKILKDQDPELAFTMLH